jgi:hypothetical protein
LVRLLDKIVDEDKTAKIIIFTGTKKMADECTSSLRRDGFGALSIHGDKKQQERDWVMHEFKSGKAPILIATDVAARGLGIVVLNFFFFYFGKPLHFIYVGVPFNACLFISHFHSNARRIKCVHPLSFFEPPRIEKKIRL